MNRRTRVLLVALTALGVLLAASPANAAGLSWDDPAGDAKQSGLEPLGAPEVLANNAALDITKVTLGSDGTNFTYEAKVPEMTAGAPHPSYGYFFRLYFTVGDSEFHFRVGEGPTGPVFALRDPAGAATECKDCKGAVDREAKRVVVTAPLASLSAAFKAAGAGDSAAGQTVTLPEVLSQRYMAGQATLTADTAAAPEGASFTL